jgi:hypothetical protein
MPAVQMMLNMLYAIRALPEIAENAIGGFLVAFTDSAQRDKFNQYFTRDTDFGLNLLGENAQRPLNYHHNFGEITGAIGFVRSLEVRDEGLYAVAELDTQHPSYPFVRSQVDSGGLGYSAETLPNWMAVEKDGRVSRFPVFGAAITPRPSAPEGRTTVGALRGLGLPDEELGLDASAPDEGVVNTSLRSVWFLPQEIAEQPPTTSARRVTIPYAQTRPVTPPVALPDNAHMRGNVQSGGRIEVTSPLDEHDLLDVMGWYCLGQEALTNSRKQLELPMPREQFYRGIMERVGKFYDEDTKRPVSRLTPAYDIVDKEGEVFHLRSDWEKFSDEHLTGEGRPFEGREYRQPQDFLRADELMGSDVANGGDDWVFTAWSDMVWEDIRLKAAVVGNLPSFNMESNPFDHPVMPAVGYGRLVREADDRSQMDIPNSPYPDRKVDTSGTVTFTIQGVLGDGILYTGWLRKWSQLSVVSLLQRNMLDTIIRTADRVALWGDETDGTTDVGYYGDSAGPSGTEKDHLLALDGIIHYALAAAARNLSGAGAALTTDKFIAQRAKMGALGVHVEHLIDILPYQLYFDMLGFTEYETLDVYGSQAVNKTGEMARLQNIPLIVSEEFGLGNATGQYPYDDSGTLKGNLLLDTRTWKVGKGTNGVNITVEKAPGNDAFFMYGGLEMDLKPFQSNGVCYQFNLL